MLPAETEIASPGLARSASSGGNPLSKSSFLHHQGGRGCGCYMASAIGKPTHHR